MKQVSTSLGPRTIERLEYLAGEEELSLSSYIRNILLAHVKEHDWTFHL